MTSPFRETINAICSALPGAVWSDPWGGGHDAWKVGDKMFACMGSMTPGVSVKCADVETATLLKEHGIAHNAPYFYKSWVRFDEDADTDELKARIEASYKIIFSKLPAKTRKAISETQEVA
ncbi:MAG: MmcQ/YjbR family DNA-binding protein [Pseudomonadota bacterium]